MSLFAMQVPPKSLSHLLLGVGFARLSFRVSQEDIGFEDKPAEIDAKQLEALQRMFGGSSASDK